MPPTEPEPEALDHMMSGSSGSGVAQPLSPPATENHSERAMVPPPPPPPPPKPPVRLLLGTRYEGPSCRLPYTQYGILVSTVAWYIWATGNCRRYHDRPRVVEIDTPPSLATIMRSGLVGSIQMSWLSPPGELPKPRSTLVRPPSRLRVNAAERK